MKCFKTLILGFFIGIFTIKAQTVVDFDGNIYDTITIGSQCWMKENLKAIHYPNGTAISGVYTYNNDENNALTYGRLYTFASLNDTLVTQSVCPTGWHIPSISEWTQLANYLGGGMVAGGKMKEADTIHWNSPNTGADNSSRFTALPGGVRNSDGVFLAIKSGGGWWNRDEIVTNIHFPPEVRCVSLGSSIASVTVALITARTYAHSVRCIEGLISNEEKGFYPKEELKFFPNPTKDKLFVEFPNNESIYEIKIQNLQSQNLQVLYPFTSNVSIDFSNILNGVYIVQVKTKDHVFVRKMIKN